MIPRSVSGKTVTPYSLRGLRRTDAGDARPPRGCTTSKIHTILVLLTAESPGRLRGQHSHRIQILHEAHEHLSRTAELYSPDPGTTTRQGWGILP